MTPIATSRRLRSWRMPAPPLAAVLLAGLVAANPSAGAEPAAIGEARPVEPASGPADRMAALGLVRYRGAWRTPQEIELIERDEAANLARKQWTGRLERLRRQLDAAGGDAAAEQIREIDDPFAVPALAAAVSTEGVFLVRGFYIEALARIRTPDALAVLVGVACDHPDQETRIAAGERLVTIGPHPAVPMLVAALASEDNARVNRAAEALGRLGVPAAIGPLIEALETRHVVVPGGATEGSTSATFTPAGGGLSMGGGSKRKVVAVRNDRVLEALVALTGTNFEWDQRAWRSWLANERALPPEFDPRRS